MAASPAILPAEERDLPAILDLIHRAYAANVAMGFRYSGATETFDSLAQAWREDKVYKLVADGAIAGTIRLTPHDGYLGVWRLCVDPALQRRGLGTALLRFAEEEAARLGLARVRLDTAKPFRDLVDWYRRRGYEVVAEVRYPQVNYPSLVMEKRVERT